MLIDNDFINTDIVDYEVAQKIMKDMDKIDYCKPVEMEKDHAELVSKFARDMEVINIDQIRIEAYIKGFRNEQSTQDAFILFDFPNNLLRNYSADYSENYVSKATPVRDAVENLFKMYFSKGNSWHTPTIHANSFL